MDPSSLIDMAITALGRAQKVNYANVICAALIAHDYFLTFVDEVKYIWPMRWNVGKIMFFLTRYPVFLDVALNIVELIHPNLRFDLCKPVYQVAAWMSFAGITIAEIIMAMRVYAIWGARREVLALLLIFYTGITVADIVLLQKSLQSLVFMPSPFPRLAPCVLIEADLSVYIDFILIMVTEFVIIIMTFWKCFSEWRASRSSLMKALFEDGVQYFVCMFAISLANLLVVRTAIVDFSGLLFGIQRVLHSILSARMLIHIRKAVEPRYDMRDLPDLSFSAAPGKGKGTGTGTESYSLEQMEFGEPGGSGTYTTSASNATELQTMGTTTTRSWGRSFFKWGRPGPLNVVHITRGTIADEEFYRAIGKAGGTPATESVGKAI